MKKYKILKKTKYCLSEYSLVPLKDEDMESIRVWRNQQMSILRQNKKITKKEQISYYKESIDPTFNQKNPKLILFSYLKNDVLIGYGGFVHIDWNLKKTEISFLAKTSRNKIKKTYVEDFNVFLKLIVSLGFKEIGFDKLVTETYSIRSTTIRILEENGFQLERLLHKHIFINNKYHDSLLHGYIKDNYIKKIDTG
jgi:hypothetical protein